MPEDSGSGELKGSISEERHSNEAEQSKLSEDIRTQAGKTDTAVGSQLIDWNSKQAILASSRKKTSVIGEPEERYAMSIGERQPPARHKAQVKSESAEGDTMVVPGLESAAAGQTEPVQDRSPANWCAGCREPIRDKFIFSVIDLHWHQDCVQCSVCAGKLDERCYTWDGKLYCKLDYWRRFGPKCFGCRESIERSELVQRVKGNRVYHVKCFTCTDCRKQLKAGEMFHLLEGTRGLLCKDDYSNSLGKLEASQEKSNGHHHRHNLHHRHHQIFYTLTSSGGGSGNKQQRASKLASDQVVSTGGGAGLSGGEEEPVEEEEVVCEGEEEEGEGEEEDEEMGEDEEEEEEDEREDSDAAESLDGMRRLLGANYHLNENDENLSGCCRSESAGDHQPDAPKRRARQQQLDSAVNSNPRRKRRRKRGSVPPRSDTHKKLAGARNGESILHGITATHPNNSILAHCPNSAPPHQHQPQPQAQPGPQQQPQKSASFSSLHSTASNSSTNSSSSQQHSAQVGPNQSQQPQHSSATAPPTGAPQQSMSINTSISSMSLKGETQ